VLSCPDYNRTFVSYGAGISRAMGQDLSDKDPYAQLGVSYTINGVEWVWVQSFAVLIQSAHCSFSRIVLNPLLVIASPGLYRTGYVAPSTHPPSPWALGVVAFMVSAQWEEALSPLFSREHVFVDNK
jgi:hypothetical protein